MKLRIWFTVITVLALFVFAPLLDVQKAHWEYTCTNPESKASTFTASHSDNLEVVYFSGTVTAVCFELPTK